MAKFIVIHGYVGDPDKGFQAMNEPELVNALVAANGKTVPGKCSFTWIPYSFGRKDIYGVCLWEAASVEDVEASLVGVKHLLTADIMQVDEIVWP